MATEVRKRQTLASVIHADMREKVLSGAIRPGTKINIRDACEQFSVGLSPMREALSRLTADGLVQQADNRGFTVTPISVAELDDLTNARCWINEVGIRQAIAHAPASWEEGVRIALHRLDRTPRTIKDEAGGGAASERNPDWESAHRHFHRILVQGSGSHWLTDVCDRLFDASQRYRHVGRLATGKRNVDAEEEHKAIARAAVDRKADEAAELLTAHFRRTADLVRSFVEEQSTTHGA